MGYCPDGFLYVLELEQLVALVARTGEIAKSFAVMSEFQRVEAPFGPSSKVAVTENYIYCGTRRNVIAFDKNRGTIEWTYPTNATVPPDGGPVALEGRLYVVDGKGNMLVFEGR